MQNFIIEQIYNIISIYSILNSNKLSQSLNSFYKCKIIIKNSIKFLLKNNYKTYKSKLIQKIVLFNMYERSN